MLSAETKTPVTVDADGFLLDTPTPPSAASLPLKTIDQARREMASVYRAMKGGSIDTSDGTKLIYALSQIAKLIEVGELEARIELISHTLNKNKELKK